MLARSKVDRHIRLLDQSIREQEMSISFGLRQGTHPSLLPDLAAPSRWARATRVTHSPVPGLSEDDDTLAGPTISAGSEVTIGMATTMGSEVPRAPSSSFKKSKKSKKRKTDKAVSEAEATPVTTTSSTRSLRLKVPPLNMVQGDAAADPNEPKYCYCNRVSFGNVRCHFLGSGYYPNRTPLPSDGRLRLSSMQARMGKHVARNAVPCHSHNLTLIVPPRLRRFDGAAAISDVVLPGLRAACTEGRDFGFEKERAMIRMHERLVSSLMTCIDGLIFCSFVTLCF
jgi:hypothetical protein